MSQRVWLTWETQRRNRTASAALDAQLFEFDSPSRTRHIKAAVATLKTLHREQPKLIIAQNPSIVLAALAVRYGKFFRIPVAIDAHNAGLEPFGGEKRWANTLSQWLLRNADLTIVSNAALAERVHRHGGRAAVLPDPLPVFPDRASPHL
ncbi:hypothetical protein CAI21_19860 [Alkalilimnicola ehrlichii]|uniref:Glycosyltransferase subfamily 4-like N-terminal domain-containing protein n=1 Tax=Alkalilimnicola ehrlichii TaxID=351052 RepID=A0A3E0WJH1_9GAMM|nr:glycosyltransferase [Alkalilimnicola ehrlichii]RFA25152.1 hypothetical protein CAI21_19860 [Alkalilimnicola ehrlichii]RFA32106.1 hypothetical protein CAL65_20440 [Alkalilimnicola ehrlichii]